MDETKMADCSLLQCRPHLSCVRSNAALLPLSEGRLEFMPDVKLQGVTPQAPSLILVACTPRLLGTGRLVGGLM